MSTRKSKMYQLSRSDFCATRPYCESKVILDELGDLAFFTGAQAQNPDPSTAVNINAMWIVFATWRVKLVVLTAVKEICGPLIVCFGEVIRRLLHVTHLVKPILPKAFNVTRALVTVIIHRRNIKLISLDNTNDFEFMTSTFTLHAYLVMSNSRNWYADSVATEDTTDRSKWFHSFIQRRMTC